MRYRIVQVAPLTHSEAYVVQVYKESINIDAFTKKQQDLYVRLGYVDVEIAKNQGFPTKWKWEIAGASRFSSGEFHDSFYSAYRYIMRIAESEQAEKIRREELAAFQAAAHGSEIVVGNYEF